MAPLKRVYNALEQREPASSNLASSQPHARKRPRIFDALGDGNEDTGSTTVSTASSIHSGEEEDEEEPSSEDDELEPDVTQTIDDRSSRAQHNAPQEQGVIERVDCYNFMCHEHFSVDLGPLINFIVGKNGSGKSAVLTALTLCLGGKASATNRGQTLKNFIKEGKETSTIVVRIKNQGTDAYRPNDFGDSIIVERHFSRSGTSGFRIKDHKGKIISTKKGDLDAISDYFALQIDNPMNVLSQDMARQFISSSSPADKYKFFVKGVQLEQLDQDYRVIEESIDQIQEKIQIHSEEMKILERKRDRTKDRLAASDKREGLREKIRNLRAQAAWSQVEEQERVRDTYDNEIANITSKLASHDTDVENLDAIFQRRDAEHKAALAAVEEAKSVLAGIEDEKNDIKHRYDETLKERSGLQSEQSTIRDQIKEIKKRLQDTTNSIAEEHRKLADVDGGSVTRRQAELQQKKAAAVEAKNAHTEHKRNFTRLENDLAEAEKAADGRKGPVIGKRREIENAEANVRSLLEGQGQQAAGFHERMPILLRAIRDERSFGERPVGPVGQHVRLLKPEWSSILENSLGGTLGSFVVTSKRDMNILSGIMQRVNCSCPILIGNMNGNMDTSAHEPDPKFDTALRVLQIDNELVTRQLIINNGIEQMLLIENVEEASRILFDGSRPRNVRRCFCIDQRNKRRGMHLAYGRTGDPSQSPVPEYNGRPRMKTDIEIQVRLQRDAINILKGHLLDLEQQQRQGYEHLEKCSQALVRHKRMEREFNLAVQRAEDEVEELKEAIDRDSVKDGRLDALNSALEEAEEEKKLNEASFGDSVNAMDKVIATLKSIKREMAAKDADISTADDTVRDRAVEEDRASNSRSKALEDKNVAVGQHEQLGRDKDKLQEKREQIAAIIIDYSEKASRVSPRVTIDARETPSSLDRKLERLMRDVQRYDEEMGASREEIAAEAAEANSRYELSKQQVTDFAQTARMFKHTLVNRQERWRKFRSHISARAKLQFTYLLSERSFRGKVLIDHREKLLNLQVEPDSTKVGSGRAAKTLSGGEKSYSQICLLLAMWEAMGSPIRCLDEFDVYMDGINRKMTIDILMVAARRSVGRQFILITPGSRTDISMAPDVRIKELAEPERGQRTLPFVS